MKKLITILAFFALSLSFGQVIPVNALKIKGITSVQRDGLTINAGEFPIIYNTTAGEFQRWNGAAWEVWDSGAAQINQINTFSGLNDVVADKSLPNLNRSVFSFIRERIKNGRVDFVGFGDSNQGFGGHGWDHGFQKALLDMHPMYATGLISVNDNAGSGSGLGYLYNGISGVKGSISGAPFQLDNYLSLGLGDGLKPANYAYFSDGQTFISTSNSGMILLAGNVLAQNVNNIRFHLAYGTFPSGSGSFKISARLEQSPWTLFAESDLISTNTGAYSMQNVSIDVTANPSFDTQQLGFKLTRIGTTPITGPYFATYMRLEAVGVDKGFSYSTMYGVGGQSMRDLAYSMQTVSDSTISHYLDQVRRLQGGVKTVVMVVNFGLNDRGETATSVGPGAIADGDSPEAYLDNFKAFKSRIEEVYSGEGWDLSELFWLVVPSHPVNDPEDLELASYRDAIQGYLNDIPNAELMDPEQITSNGEMVDNIWYASSGTDVNHLTQSAYEELSKRILNYSGIFAEGDPNAVVSSDIDTFAELDAIVADKSLANLNDAQVFSSNIDFGAGIDVTGAVTATGGLTIGSARIVTSATDNSVYVGDRAGTVDDGTNNRNTGVGNFALDDVTTGTDNVAVGQAALFKITTAARNLGLGTASLSNLTSGNDNVGIGQNSGVKLADGIANLTIANSSLYLGTGARAAADNASNEVVIGKDAIGNGSNTVTIGNSSVTDNYFTGNLHSTGQGTFGAGIDVTGKMALDDGGSIYIGEDAGLNDDGTTNYNVGIGVDAADAITTGFRNVAIGPFALSTITTGQGNMAIGFSAMQFMAGGSTGNIGIGRETLKNADGNNNVAIGELAGTDYGGDVAILNNINNSTLIGYNSEPLNDNGTNETVIGYQAIGNGSNTVTIGNSSVTDNYFTGNLHSTGQGTFGAGIDVTGAINATANSFVTAANPRIGVKASLNGFPGFEWYENNVRQWAALHNGTGDNLYFPNAAGTIVLNLQQDGTVLVPNGNLTVTNSISAGASISTSGNLTATGTITGSNLSGTNTGDQTITLTGDVTGSGTGSFATTIAAGAVDASKIESTNAATDGYFPSYDSATGGVTWEAISTTDSGSGYAFNTVLTDNIYIRNAQVTNGGGATDRKIWNQFTVTADSVWLHKDSVSLTGNPFIIQPWTNADSVVVRKGLGTNFYIADSAAALSADGLVIKGRNPVTAIKVDATSFFLQGNFSVYNIPAVVYFSNNASTPTPNEAAVTTGWAEFGLETGSITMSLEPTDVQNGDDAILITCDIDLTGSPTGIQLSLSNLDPSKTYTITGYIKAPNVNVTVELATDKGWGTGASQQLLGPATYTQFSVTDSPTGTTAQLEVFSNVSFDASEIILVDNVVVTEN